MCPRQRCTLVNFDLSFAVVSLSMTMSYCVCGEAAMVMVSIVLAKGVNESRESPLSLSDSVPPWSVLES